MIHERQMFGRWWWAAFMLLALAAVAGTAAQAQRGSSDGAAASQPNPTATNTGQSDTGQSDTGQSDTDGAAAAPESEPSGATAAAATGANDGDAQEDPPVNRAYALTVLGIGMALVLGMIIAMKANAFLALITAAMVVSLLAGGPVATRIARVATAFGEKTGGIGLVIAMAAIIGKCMLDSGAADRIVRAFVRLFGEKLAALALMASGFVLAVPVFFDTVFYLLVPLARSLHVRTRKNYLMYILAIAAGGAITHTLVPPTPGPLAMADNLRFPVGFMIMVGIVVALPAALAGLLFSVIANKVMPVPMRKIGNEPEPKPLDDSELPPLWLSLAPVVLPVLLISCNTICETIRKTATEPLSDTMTVAADWAAVIGNPNLALLVSTFIAMWTLLRQRGLSRTELSRAVEIALMSGGVIILITAAGGAFGEMLKVARVGDAIKEMFQSDAGNSGLAVLTLGFGLAAVLKVAQGSSTVAMVTGSSMLVDLASQDLLGFHPVYLACAIGAGSLIGSWMNDSGFWVFAKMGGLTEIEALKSWTLMLIVLGLVAFGMTMLLCQVLPDPLTMFGVSG